MSNGNGPRLDDLINEWRKDTSFKDWSYTRIDANHSRPHPCGYLHSGKHNASGLLQIWSDHVMVIIGDDTLSAFQASEHYRRYLKEMAPPSSNQWMRLEAADPEFFEILGQSMEIIDNAATKP